VVIEEQRVGSQIAPRGSWAQRNNRRAPRLCRAHESFGPSRSARSGGSVSRYLYYNGHFQARMPYGLVVPEADRPPDDG
jgi:hypothetical protein